MIQFRYDQSAIKHLMSEFNIEWDYDLGHNWETRWNANLTRVIDEINNWCKNNGISDYATGFTQIELCITFGSKSEAMLFKLRWYHAQTP